MHVVGGVGHDDFYKCGTGNATAGQREGLIDADLLVGIIHVSVFESSNRPRLADLVG